MMLSAFCGGSHCSFRQCILLTFPDHADKPNATYQLHIHILSIVALAGPYISFDFAVQIICSVTIRFWE